MKSKMKLEVVETVKIRHIITATKSWPDGCRDDPEKAIKHLKSMIDLSGINSITKKTEILESDYSIAQIEEKQRF